MKTTSTNLQSDDEKHNCDLIFDFKGGGLFKEISENGRVPSRK